MRKILSIIVIKTLKNYLLKIFHVDLDVVSPIVTPYPNNLPTLNIVTTTELYKSKHVMIIPIFIFIHRLGPSTSYAFTDVSQSKLTY